VADGQVGSASLSKTCVEGESDLKGEPMNVFRKLWQAIETLATSLNGLAMTVDAFSQEVRQRSGVSVPLLTDGDAEAEPIALPSGKKRR
jgi:hypothetical protein